MLKTRGRERNLVDMPHQFTNNMVECVWWIDLTTFLSGLENEHGRPMLQLVQRQFLQWWDVCPCCLLPVGPPVIPDINLCILLRLLGNCSLTHAEYLRFALRLSEANCSGGGAAALGVWLLSGCCCCIVGGSSSGSGAGRLRCVHSYSSLAWRRKESTSSSAENSPISSQNMAELLQQWCCYGSEKCARSLK